MSNKAALNSDRHTMREGDAEQSALALSREMSTACRDGAIDVVERLIRDKRVSLGLQPDGYTLLQHAISGGHASICKILLDAGADPLELLPLYSMPYTALHWAADVERIDICRMLVDAGASPGYLPTEVPSFYRTPLQASVGAGKVASVQFFHEECGEPLDQCSIDGQSVWELAKRQSGMLAYFRSLELSSAIAGAISPDEAAAPKRSTSLSPL